MSYKRFIAEILNAQADHLLAKSNTSQEYITLFPAHIDLHALLHLATHINHALKPVKPSAKFQMQLYEDLMAAAHQSLTESKVQPASYHLDTLRSPKVSIPLTMGLTLLVGFFWRRWRQKEADFVPVLQANSTKIE